MSKLKLKGRIKTIVFRQFVPSELKCSESRENRDELFSHTKDTKQSAYSRQKLLKVTPTLSVSNYHADERIKIIFKKSLEVVV